MLIPEADASTVAAAQVSDAQGCQTHLCFVTSDLAQTLPPYARAPKSADTLPAAVVSPYLAGLQLLPYAALLAGIPMGAWEEALDLVPPPAPLGDATVPGTAPALPARSPFTSVFDPAVGHEVIDLMSSADDSDIEVVIAASKPAAVRQEPSTSPSGNTLFVKQCVVSLYLATASLPVDGCIIPEGRSSSRVPAATTAAALADDLCGPLPPANLVGVGGLRLILRICGAAAISVLSSTQQSAGSRGPVSSDPSQPAKYSCLPPALFPATRVGAAAILAAAPALLVTYRVSLAVALTQLWHAFVSDDFVMHASAGTSLTAHPWLHQLSAPSLLTSLLWEAVDPLERSKHYAHTLPFLSQVRGTKN